MYELFSMCGEVKRIIMGLDRIKKTPCGFCFIEYPTKLPRFSTSITCMHMPSLEVVLREKVASYHSLILPAFQEVYA